MANVLYILAIVQFLSQGLQLGVTCDSYPVVQVMEEGFFRNIGESEVKSKSESGKFRNVVVVIENGMDMELYNGEAFEYLQDAAYLLPSVVRPGENVTIQLEAPQSSLMGVTGAIVYRFRDLREFEPVSLVIMYSVPFSRLLYNNWFGVAIEEGSYAQHDARRIYKRFARNTFSSPRNYKYQNQQPFQYASDEGTAYTGYGDSGITATMSDEGKSIIRVKLVTRRINSGSSD